MTALINGIQMIAGKNILARELFFMRPQKEKLFRGTNKKKKLMREKENKLRPGTAILKIINDKR